MDANPNDGETAMSSLPGKFVWFEHVSNDMSKARKFYDPLFDWHTESMPMGPVRYPMILNRGEGVGGYRSADVARPYWLGYLSVDDVDAAHRDALAAGARSLEAPSDYGSIGRGAVIADRSGAVFALWKSAEGDRPDDPKAPPG